MESTRNYPSEYSAIKDKLLSMEIDIIDEICTFLKENELKCFRFVNSQGIEFNTVKFISQGVFKVEFVDEKLTYKVKQTSSNMDLNELITVWEKIKFFSQYGVK